MLSITTVTQKGQITVPQWLRLKYGMELYGKVVLEAGDGYIKVKPVKDILDMTGTVNPIKGRSALKARAWVEKHYRRT